MGQDDQAALLTAIDDEFRARATYQAVLDAYGNIAPFSMIEQAERRHITALASLFQQYGMAVPADRWTGNVAPPPSVLDACQAGVDAEIANYQMYDRLLQSVQDPQVRFVFTNLRNASAFHHLPAFQACAAALGAQPAHVSPQPMTTMANEETRANWGHLLIGALIGAGAVWAWRQWGRRTA
ncbi:MAG TPA: DUF2202 domain-containing protein [Chromatiaceae bacterium]|nr:DUF2202 domain-containing protein [Chromatiaceae bacterium]